MIPLLASFGRDEWTGSIVCGAAIATLTALWLWHRISRPSDPFPDGFGYQDKDNDPIE